MYYCLLLQQFVYIHKHGETREIGLNNGAKKIQNIKVRRSVFLHVEDSRFMDFLNITSQQALDFF